jgi:hypothetical protein
VPLSKDPGRRAAQLRNLEKSNGRPPGHGLTSKRVMRPYREAAEAWARSRWPWLDDTRVHLVTGPAARVARVRDWEDQNDIVLGRPGRATRAQQIVVDADRWEARLLVLIKELDAEARERGDRPVSLQDVFREYAEGDSDRENDS